MRSRAELVAQPRYTLPVSLGVVVALADFGSAISTAEARRAQRKTLSKIASLRSSRLCGFAPGIFWLRCDRSALLDWPIRERIYETDYSACAGEHRRPRLRAHCHHQALLGPKGKVGGPFSFFRSQIALRARETRRSGKRRPGTSLASYVALAGAYKLPVNRNHSE